eukprot:CAMPEP_0168424454 /NCGR_PEP_ID=MMETSP0228-20121227/34830_1 /TAXON_ID=133427 /ORGANISM="Protoceratium reticulatum, Strain CCCM 535 (=CCMP 1889)" /LENGTH=425 /DNA_ID=CAMNT_0008438443 /DNA_START=48 /DNA_END=1322 /DNA_ORIENTATION=-
MAAMGDARALSKEAYIYGWPIAENYNTLYAYTIDEGSKSYKGPFNTLVSAARVYTPADTVVVTPNSDTPYTFAWLDLRAEPLVLSVPEIEQGRYFSFQLIDMYTHNFAYLGTRATGNGGGAYAIAGPGWVGEAAGVDAVMRCETPFALVIGRTQLFTPEDLNAVVAIQAKYKLDPLSAFLGTAAPPPPPALAWPKADPAAGRTAKIFEILDFLLQHLPVHPSEESFRARLMLLGIGSGGLQLDALDAVRLADLEGGVADAWEEYAAEIEPKLTDGSLLSGELFGTRDFLANCYIRRMAGAKVGLYGNSREEAMYPIYKRAAGEQLDGSRHAYTLTLAPEDMAMALSFWSLTMYDGRTQLLVENPLGRYLVNSPMLPGMQRGADGSLTIYVSASPPAKELECNWLPAPNGPFYAVLRLYLPRPEAC